MKRKLITLFTLIAILLSLSLSVQAAAPWVVDNAYLLSSDETADLNRQIQELRDQLELEIVIVTINGTGNKDVQQYADDFYDTNGYGFGPTNSGILLLLDMNAREWYMSTCGEAIYIFTDYGLDQLGEQILPYLSDGDYYGAFTAWIQALPAFVQAYHNQGSIDGYVDPDAYESPYGEEIVYYNDGSTFRYLIIAVVVGLVASLITVLIMRSRMNTAKLQKGAANYLKSGSFHLRQRSDMFLYSRVTKERRQQSNTSHSGGGSSVHRSSGGVSHGGRGGRF